MATRTRTVNLDALIPRADFEAEEDLSQGPSPDTIQIRDLERGTSFFFGALRKPDFQRETSSWSPQKIRDFIKTFVEGDLIPAIILWRSPGGTFIIDGAHRLSALIAWVENDYGDGAISQKFFGPIRVEQLRIADQTRKLINREFKTYQEHITALSSPAAADPAVRERARAFGQLAIQLQWVRGNASKAENSFFKINREATLIKETELQILLARRKPNGLAARAMLRAGRGYKYWQHFDATKQARIEETAKEIYDQLWTPILNTPIDTLDVPVAGANQSAYTLPLLFDFITLATNGKTRNGAQRTGGKNRQPVLADDLDGTATIDCLNKVHRIADSISSKKFPGSLGLHPIVYFYSSEGRFQPTSFLGVVRFVQQLQKNDRLSVFAKHRRRFEEFIVKYKHFSNQITAKWGSGIKAYDKLGDLLRLILDRLIAGDDEPAILRAIAADSTLGFLNPSADSVEDREIGKHFNIDTKSEAFLNVALKEAVRCGVCGGYTHINSRTVDHIMRRRDGGLGEASNAQFAHPFCNSTLKN